MSTTSAGTNACDYERLDNGIHYFRFNKASKEALDYHFEVLERLMTEYPVGTVLPALLDFRPAGFPPITYAFQRVRVINSKYPRRAYFRFAFVHPPNALATVVQSFFQLSRSADKAHFFPAPQYDDAEKWLIQGAS